MAKRKYNKSLDGHTEYLSEYRTYIAMKARCLNKSNRQYKDYGERGIGVCKRWLGPSGFENFYKDMGKRPHEENGRPYQLDRLDNMKGYSPDNCRWVTVKQNQQNRRDNLNTDLFGETMCVSEICRLLHIKRTTVTEAVRLRGISVEDAIVNSIKKTYGERAYVC